MWFYNDYNKNIKMIMTIFQNKNRIYDDHNKKYNMVTVIFPEIENDNGYISYIK